MSYHFFVGFSYVIDMVSDVNLSCIRQEAGSK